MPGLIPSLRAVIKSATFEGRIAFFAGGDGQIELIEPSAKMEEDYAARRLNQRGEGLFHLSLYVEKIEYISQLIKMLVAS